MSESDPVSAGEKEEHSGSQTNSASSSSEGEIEDADSDDTIDNDNTGFIDVMRYLLQGNAAHLRIQLASAYGDDVDSEDSDINTNSSARYLNQRRLYRERIPKCPDVPDTSVIDQSELKQQFMYESGLLNPLSKRLSTNLSSIPGLQCMKEVGLMNKYQRMSEGQQARYSAPTYLPTKYQPKRLLRLNDKFFCGVYNKEGDLFMSACQDAKIRIFDTTNGQWKQIKKVACKDVGWSVLDVDFSHNGNYVAYSSWSEYIHICNIRGDTEIHNALYLEPDEEHRTGIFSLRFNADDSEIVAASNGGYIYIYNREIGKRSSVIHAHDDDLCSVSFADDSGHIIYSGGEDALIKVWDRRNLREGSPRPVGQLAGHYDSITYIDSKNDARYLITNSKDQSIKLWDIRKFATGEGINATKSQVAKQDWDYRWRPYTGKVVKKKLPGDCSLMTYYGHSVVRTLIRARFSPVSSTGQKYIYCGDGMGRVVIYDILTGKTVRILESNECPTTGQRVGHHREVVRDVSWHPYDNNLISSGWDGVIYKWECNFSV